MDGVCGGDPSRIYRSAVSGGLGAFAMPLAAADVGATLQASVDPNVHDGFSPNVSLAYSFGTYTASNFIQVFSGSTQARQLTFLSGAGTWNLNLGPGSYTARAVVCGVMPAAVATFTVAPPQTQNGAVPHFDFPEVPGGGGGACTTPPCNDRILASIAPWDHYESQYQEASPVSGTVRFKVRGTLLDFVTHQPKRGTVYLRLEDPDDTAQYVVANGDAHSPNDGACATFVGATPGVACQAAFAVQADASGRFEATVTASIPVAVPAGAPATAAAGNNYQITASADPAFPCNGTNPCAKSGIFTLWKRVYVEEEHMFRKGTFLRGEAAAGGMLIPVDDPVPFQGLSPGATLELVHGGTSFYFDFVTFRSLQQNTDGTWSVLTRDPIPRDYGSPSSGQPAAPVLSVLRDAVGVVADGTYRPNTDYTAPLYETMFVELKPISPIVEEVPFIREMSTTEAVYYASQWFEHGVLPASGVIKTAEPNVLHRIGAAQMPLARGANGCYGPQLGVTAVTGGTNYSLILEQRIADLVLAPAFDAVCHVSVGTEYLGAPPSRVSGEATAHETTHFWIHRARTTSMDAQGHCVAQRFQHDGLQCLMHTPYAGSGLYDGQVFLHYDSHGGDSEYMWVRREADPVPQQ